MEVLLFSLLYTYVFYLLFLMCMGFYHGWKKFPLWVKLAVLPPALLAGAMDLVFNYTFACVLFLAWPPAGCWTFTKRISRYKDIQPNTWRGKLGNFICVNLLDPAGINGHCS